MYISICQNLTGRDREIEGKKKKEILFVHRMEKKKVCESKIPTKKRKIDEVVGGLEIKKKKTQTKGKITLWDY